MGIMRMIAMRATPSRCSVTGSGVSLLLTIPVVVWSSRHPGVARLRGCRCSPAPNTSRPILGTVVFLYGGLVFIRGAIPASSPTGSPG